MSRLIPLSRWREYPPEHCVAQNHGSPITRDALETRVRCWIAALQPQEGQRWAVYHGDSLEFLCILLALWQLRRTACIPSDNRPGTIARLAAGLDGLAGEFDAAAAVLAGTEDDGSSALDWIVPEADWVALEIYTSGSTGDPKSISKTIAQLESEIATIESLWPSESDNLVLATVSHQHLYGMTFGLFWPFSSGRAFETSCCELIEDIRFKAGMYHRFALVASPSHLGRFNASIDWREIADRCDYVISSAAALARVDSLEVGRLLDAPVREIYGSSETGAIAWRLQQADASDALWRALPGVRLESSAAGNLLVDAPYLGAAASLELPDRVEFVEGGGFRLLGRVDNIVKVEGKRVSLAALERLLQQQEWVKQVKALTLERVRVETAIVMQLDESGQRLLQTRGRRSLIASFKALLAQEFAAVVIPRRWRFVEEMPYNAQGKLPLDKLRSLFVKDAIEWPQIIEQQVNQDELILHCRIPSELLYFDGHMPDRPILPGIVQLHWAEAYGRELLAVNGRFERLEVVKFQHVILPENQVTLKLAYDESKGKLSFRYESERGVHSSGRICFGR